MLAPANSLGPKDQLGGAHLCSVRNGVADLNRGLHSRKVLAQQARLFSACTNSMDPKRLPRHEGQRQGGSQDLPSSFAFRSVMVIIMHVAPVPSIGILDYKSSMQFLRVPMPAPGFWAL